MCWDVGICPPDIHLCPAAHWWSCQPVGKRRSDLRGDHRPGDLGGCSLPGRVGSGSPGGLHWQVYRGFKENLQPWQELWHASSRLHPVLKPSCVQDSPGAGKRCRLDRHHHLPLLQPEPIRLQWWPPRRPAEADKQRPAERSVGADDTSGQCGGNGLEGGERGGVKADRGRCHHRCRSEDDWLSASRLQIWWSIMLLCRRTHTQVHELTSCPLSLLLRCRCGVWPQHCGKSGEAAVEHPEVFKSWCHHLLHHQERGDVRRLQAAAR